MIHGHIDGRSLLRIEPRTHPRIDPPIAGRSAGLGLGPSATEPAHRPYPADVFQQGSRFAIQTFAECFHGHFDAPFILAPT